MESEIVHFKICKKQNTYEVSNFLIGIFHFSSIVFPIK